MIIRRLVPQILMNVLKETIHVIKRAPRVIIFHLRSSAIVSLATHPLLETIDGAKVSLPSDFCSVAGAHYPRCVLSPFLYSIQTIDSLRDHWLMIAPRKFDVL